MIDSIMNKINFYTSDINEQYSALSFLGYNVVIRKYFYEFNNDGIKVSLRNVITHEIIHLLIIELTDQNFFKSSFEKSNYKIKESGDYFENVLFGININYFSHELITYLSNFNNFQKNLDEFKKEVQDIYNKMCIKEENKIMYLSDSECIKKGIVRCKFNDRDNSDYNEFGHCSKHYLEREISD